MATDNLQIPDIAASQNQKEVTANAAHNLLDKSGNSSTTKVISGSTSFSTTETRENRTVVLTGTPGAAFTVNMPDANKREMNVVNETNGDATIRNSAGSVGAKDVITIASGKKASFQYTGTDFYAVGSGGAGGAVAVQDEGSSILASASALNFVGAGVTATDAGSGVAQISIPPVTPGGNSGPWRFLASYDLTGLSSKEVTDFVGVTNLTHVQLRISGVTVSVDDSEVNVRIRKNASLKIANYLYALHYKEASGTNNSEGSSSTSRIPMVRTAATGSLGNATNENGDFVVDVPQPNSARVHNISTKSEYTQAFNGFVVGCTSSGRYTGTDLTAAIDGIVVLPDSGTFVSGTLEVWGLLSAEPGTPYNVPSIYVPSTPGASQVVLSHVFTRAVDFPINLAGSEFISQAAATASTVFDIQKNGVSVGSATFAISATSATFSVASAESFSLGDRLQVIAPASPDVTLADLDLNLAGVTPAVPDGSLTVNQRKGAITIVIDGGGSAITTGTKADVYLPFDCTIIASTLLADQSGSIVIDLWAADYSSYPPTVANTITASAKPTLSAASKSQDNTLTGWTKVLPAGTVLRPNVDSASTVTRVELALTVLKD